MRIQVLSELLANQIAAGEVVERPASVVKELIENSLDAQATNLKIDVKQGGQELIRIRDDGQGINKADLPLALARHATSKISQLSDLESIISLGFRGEALASISAVSRLKVTSKHFSSEQAWSISNDSERNLIEPAAHPVGTTVEVQDLFFNTPARRKFLRKPNTEFEHIQSIIHKLALSRFDIGYQLTHNSKQVLNLQPANALREKEQRVADILGHDFLQQARRIEWSSSGWTIQGWIALPSFHRSQNDMQYWYLNGRWVRDKLLTHAARQAYEDVLYNNRQPAYLLYLTGNPQQVDVNVHPTKHEVRFQDSRSVHQLLVYAIQEALRTTHTTEVKQPIEILIEEDKPTTKVLPPTPKPKPIHSAIAPRQVALALAVQEPSPSYNTIKNSISEAPINVNLGTALAQLKNTYILAQNEQGMVVVDIHAAHERLTYEKMKQEADVATQPLLIPIMVNLNRQELLVWEKHQSELASSGLVTEACGPESIMIREVPVLLQKADMKQIFRDVLADLATHQRTDRISNTMHEILGNIACKHAIQANDRLTIAEMEALLRQMEQTPNGGFCNHGRPTWKQITWQEIDKFFLRGR